VFRFHGATKPVADVPGVIRRIGPMRPRCNAACGLALAVCALALAAPAGFAQAPAAGQGTRREPLFTVDDKAGGWQRRVYDAAGNPQTSPLEGVAAAEGTKTESPRWVKLPVTLPGDNEFVVPLPPQRLRGWRRLDVQLLLPEGLPRTTDIYFFTKDWDSLWRQIRLPAVPQRGLVRFDLPLTGDEAARRWEPCGHSRPWHPLTAGQVMEFGCAFKPATGAKDTFTGDVFLVGAWLSDAPSPFDEPRIRNFGWAPQAPRVGEKLEVTFELHADYTDPFDAQDVLVSGMVATPAGAPEPVRGFYFEDFLFNPAAKEFTSALTPYGYPSFKVRYTPRQAGEHTMALTVRAGGDQWTLPPVVFEVQPAATSYHGYLRVDAKDPRLFAWDSGAPFWGLSMNVRSPFDNRYLTTAPYSNWRDEGLLLYERLFAEYEKHGITVVEVWMCSWWLGLEWINEAPGYHGVGYMNPYRAWMLDRILGWAEQHGIYLIVVMNNHGKFGMTYDTEWARNPFNVANGGYLQSCEEYFSDARAKKAFQKYADYTLSRWTHSPHILMWKLFTEVDLTGNTLEFYLNPVVADWHKEMGAYVKNHDWYKHPITTHWMLSYNRINDAIADLPELDVLTTDAYYQQNGTRQLLELLWGGARMSETKKKPLLVTEFGGGPYADSMGNLMKQAHLGIWTGYFCGSPVAPLYWWFALVEEKNLYPYYDVLHKFTQGDEDRRGMAARTEELADKKIMLCELRSPERVLLWGMDTDFYLPDNENPVPIERGDVTLPVAGLAPGAYAVEYWNIETGAVARRDTLNVANAGETLTLKLPPFRKDFAVKIRKTPAK